MNSTATTSSPTFPPSTGPAGDDWFTLPEPVRLTALAEQACGRTASGDRETAGAKNLRYALWRFYLARQASEPDAQFLSFRVPVEIRPGLWKRVALFAYRETPMSGWTVGVEN